MSQRRKGPGRPPPAAQFLPSPCTTLPEPGLSFYPFPKTRDLPSPRRPLEPVVSVFPSVYSTCPRPTLGHGLGRGFRHG